MDSRSILKSLATLAASILFAGVFFFGWLAVFIPAFKMNITSLKVVGWLSAPLVTALGFGTGLWIVERRLAGRQSSFLRVLIWPFVGCSVGAAAVFCFGPMLIVFGMFVAGTASVLLREALLQIGMLRDGGGQCQTSSTRIEHGD